MLSLCACVKFVCEFVCVKLLYVKFVCVCVKLLYVSVCAGGGGRRRRHPGYRIKNKNPTQRCGEKSQTQTARCHMSHTYVYFAAMDLRAKDVEVSKPKRDRGKQAANTCIDRAHGCLRCALTVSRVSCAVAMALFSSSFEFVLRVGAVSMDCSGVRDKMP